MLHQRGSGKSRNMPINKSTINIGKYTEDIELLRQERGDNKIILMGISWGGLLAMNYAAHFPDHVSNLLLVSSAPPSHSVWNVLFDNQYARRSQSELDSMDLLQKIFSTKTEKELDSLKRVNPNSKEVLSYKSFIDIHVRAMYYDRSKISPKNINDLFYNFNFQPIPIIDQEVLETKWDITEKLKKLKTLALIVYGRQDDQGESTFYLQKESLLFSEMHVIEQCGHEILEEQADDFFGVLRGYLDRR
ncbi:MAG: alpha/beta hydrolase [Saprospiraceae bacterium]|nr:alpha/beta hydrolase [Saprospiraceae bacterium]